MCSGNSFFMCVKCLYLFALSYSLFIRLFQAGLHKLHRINELQVPYTAAHEFLVAVGYTIYLAITDLFVDLKGLPDDQVGVVAS